MRAALYRTTGPADVLELAELPDPEPGPGELRVRLSYSGVNPTDWRARSGNNQVPMAFPYQIPGQDGAGTVDAVGAGVSPERIGTRAWVYHAALNRPEGTAAEYVVVPADRAVELPDSVGVELGACLGIPYITACVALLSDGDITDRSVLVAGGAGAVGSACVQIGTFLGARVITTVSTPEKAAHAQAAGADRVVNYREQNAAEMIARYAPQGVDRVVEVALTSNLEMDLTVIRTGGTIVAYARETEEVAVPVLPLMRKNIRLAFMLVYQSTPAQLSQAVDVVTRFLRQAEPVPLPVHTFDLDDVAAAHRAVEKNIYGRVLLALE